MSGSVPKLRVFAGPNGSGKSTIHTTFPYSLGVYVNADEIKKEVQRSGTVDISTFGLSMTTDEARARLRASSLLRHLGMDALAEAACVLDTGALAFPGHENAPYLEAITAEVVRDALVEVCAPFSFETVMSSVDKVDLLQRAREAGFRVYLYYVSTVDVRINVNRVAVRVAAGGHPVPEDKIVDRYTRSLKNLADALRQSDRAFLYDNSGESAVAVGEVTDGRSLSVPDVATVPWWIKTYVWNPLTTSEPE